VNEENDMGHRSDESELRNAIHAQEVETAKMLGALKAMAEIMAGHKLPECFEPEPAKMASQLIDLRQERDRALGDLATSNASNKRLTAHLHAVGEIVGAVPFTDATAIVHAVEAQYNQLESAKRQLRGAIPPGGREWPGVQD